MEIHAWKFFSFWALISISFLHLGLDKLDQTALPKSISFPVTFFFRHALAISVCHSSSYALIFRPGIELQADRRYVWLMLGSLIAFSYMILEPIVWNLFPLGIIMGNRYLFLFQASFMWYQYEPHNWYFPLCTLINFLLLAFVDNPLSEKISLALHMAFEASLFLIRGQGLFYPLFTIFASFLTSACWAAISGFRPHTEVSWDDPSSKDETFEKIILPRAMKAARLASNVGEITSWKIVRFAIALMGTALFQKFFRLTTLDEVLVFLYLAVVCLANLTLLRVEDDLGFFNFVLGNVIVGCTVSQFGLGCTTWIVYGTSLFLFGLRSKLQSLMFETVEDGEDAREVVVLF